MGIIIGKFRKKKSTYEILEKLEKEIVSIEEFGRSTEQTRKKIIGRFILLAISVYIVLAFGLYIYYQRISSNQRVICIVPLVAFPVIIWAIKRFLTWYYSRKLRRNEKKLVSLKDEKKKILDNVMETETYKVAKKILDKFCNDTVKKPLPITAMESTPTLSKPSAIVPSSTVRTQTGLRQRNPSRVSVGAFQTPYRSKPLSQLTASPIVLNRSSPTMTSMVPSMGPIPGTPLPLPRNILPRDRSVLDKMVDYLVGDGPSNRYALICRQCNSHNGMSLKEEFEYLSFRCCYCSTFNPARKKRPTGPKFETTSSPLKALPPNTSDSEKNSDSDSDAGSTKPIITELREDSPDIAKLSDHEKISDTEMKASDVPEMAVNGVEKEVEGVSPMEISDLVAEEMSPSSGEESENKPESENATLTELKD